jgi:O-antigen biosynthesis protein WbqP
MYQKYIKRMLDALSAFIVLIILLPIGLLIALIVKLDSNGPIIFSHKRFGQNKKPFTIYKFRSMTVEAPSDSPTSSLRNAASYITRAGKIMRKLSLDELPQVINVLKGEMSIVGPRPVVLGETSLIEEREKYNANACKPGITGWAQINGRDELGIKNKAKLDGEYVRNLGFIMDMKILLMTITAVLSIKGHKEGSDETIEDVIWEKDLTEGTYGTSRENS